MSVTIDDGGPAFPRQHSVADANDPAFKLGAKGMTLRDYFAAASMQGMLACPGSDALAWDRIARAAYEAADAMLIAREPKA